jgi:NFU1 iron-sulfur cluster scaffold homolog, mitochondrial
LGSLKNGHQKWAKLKSNRELKVLKFVALEKKVMLKAAPKNIHLYLESNPNPNSLKFVVNEVLVPEGMSIDFPDAASAADAPLALELFTYPFVDRVFYMSNFVTVTKKAEVEWVEVQNTIKEHIKNFLESGKLILDQKASAAEEAGEETETVKKIKTILDEYIRPAVEQDGGAITFHSFKDKRVTVTLQGSCSGCPSSTITLKAGIENLFKKMMPEEVEEVEALG